MSDAGFGRTAARLRQSFDESFREPPAETAETEDFLAIRVAGQPYALRLAEVSGLHADRKTTPFPSREPSSLGLTGLRGVLIPIFDLALLLGHGRGASLRWLVLAGKDDVVGLAFEGFEAHFRIAPDSVSATHDSGSHVSGVVRAAGVARPLIDIGSVRASLARAIKER